VYNNNAGLCLETQWFPDAVNQPAFASCMLAPGRAVGTRFLTVCS
jgi:galactose mutarotase-like enzyme